MKIGLIVVLALVIFIFFSTRNSGSKEEFEEKKKVSKEKLEELKKESYKDELDIANIKTIREHYGVDLKTAKELWDSIRDDYKLQQKDSIDEYFTKKIIEEEENRFDRE